MKNILDSFLVKNLKKNNHILFESRDLISFLYSSSLYTRYTNLYYTVYY